MTVRAVAILVLLVAAAVPLAVDAAHAPPPAPCHPRGCEEALATSGPQTASLAALDAAGGRAFVAGTAVVNGTSLFSVAGFDVATDSATWSTRTDIGSQARVYDLALTPDGSTLVTVGDVVSNGSTDQAVLVHDAATGAFLHGGATDGGHHVQYVDAAEAVEADDERAYVGGYLTRPATQCNGQPGAAARFTLGAIDLDTGGAVWSMEDSTFAFGHDLALHLGGGRLFYTAAFQDCATAHRPLVALDAATGAVLWARALENETTLRFSFDEMATSPDGSVLYVVGHDDGASSTRAVLWAVDAATGATRWNATWSGPQGVAMGMHVAVAPDGATVAYAIREKISFSSFVTRVHAHDAATGALAWSAVTAPTDPTALSFSPDGERVLVAGRESSGTVTVVLRADTGAQLFRSLLSPPGGSAHAAGAWMSADGEHVLTAGGLTPSGSTQSAYLRRAAALAPPEWPPAQVTVPQVGTLRVSWTPPEDDGGLPITSYALARSLSSSGPWTPLATTGNATRSFDDANVTLGVRYHYRVTAWNARGESEPSVPNGRTVSVPDAPVLTATLADGNVDLRWNAPDDNGESIVKYELFRGASPDSLEHWLTPSWWSTSATHWGVEPGETWVYAIRAVNSQGAGPLSNLATITVPTPPSAPTNATIEPGPVGPSLEATVAWEPPADDGGSPITGYRVVVYDADTGEVDHERIVEGDVLEHTFGTRLLRAYVARVSAINAAGEGDPGWANCSRGSPWGALDDVRLGSCALSGGTTILDRVSPA